MSETPEALEACALVDVLTRAEADRADACADLERAALPLRPWIMACRKELQTNPAAALPHLWAVLGREILKREREALEAAGVDLDRLQSLDPAKARNAYAATLEGLGKARTVACARNAAGLLAQVEQAPTEAERRALILDAVADLTRPEAEGDAPLADAWKAHLARMGADLAKDSEVLRLDAGKRGPWAAWLNDNLGSRAGLEPGETFILGGAPAAGKTSLAALFAVDALALGCPVLFWQLELSREETLEHLLAQVAEPADWWKVPFWNRARRDLPEAWADLLTVPRWPDPDAGNITAALVNMARQTERRRKAGAVKHACNGLLVVDYAQLLTVADSGPRNAQHEILATAASRLAKAAAENRACVLLLSQMNKADQKTGTAGGTALAGADLARMAHRVALLQKATETGTPCADGDGADVEWNARNGEARLLSWTKARGVRYTPDGTPPARKRIFWNGGRSRALHGGEAATVAGEGGLDLE